MIVIREPKTFYFDFDLPKDVDKSLNHETDFLCLDISMETMFMNKEKGKTKKLHKFILKVPQRLDLRGWNKHLALQNLFYLLHVEIRKQYKRNKHKK